jgi:hypothetical protein
MTLHFDPAKAEGLDRAQYIQALAAEGFPAHPPYPPVYRAPLLNLYDRTSPVPFRDPAAVQNYAELRLPVTERICGETGLVIAQPLLLADEAFALQTIEAVKKVNDNLKGLKRFFDEREARRAAVA